MNNAIPRNEYPRPDFVRELWQCLNGQWDFAFDDKGERTADNGDFPMKITVPFTYETPDSGLGLEEIHETVWYQRQFAVDKHLQSKRLFLHFGAVDYLCHVYLNGHLLGSHEGGYTPFDFDITRWVNAEENTLTVRVYDPCDQSQPRGKQYWDTSPAQCHYIGTTGIWQSVWLEATEGKRIEALRFTPDIDTNTVEIFIGSEEYKTGDKAVISVAFQGKPVQELTVELPRNDAKITVDLRERNFLEGAHYWWPHDPNLYDVTVELFSGGQSCDRVKSYFGMRKVSVENGEFFINNAPYYLKLVLDQGYWRQSGMTPPSDEAIRYDIEMTKKFGFNGARKHQKIEDPRYYYWADVMGLVVWGELPSCYRFNDKAMSRTMRDFTEFINRDYNHPSLIAWVPLNESWGVPDMLSDNCQQQYGEMLYHLAKAFDPTRVVSTNDGWENIKTDIAGIHDYCAAGKSIEEKYTPEAMAEPEGIYPGQRRLFAKGHTRGEAALMFTEYGGIAMKSQVDGGNWGYGQAEEGADALVQRYKDVTRAIMNVKESHGFCYTQLTDVYQEVNGLMDFDHKPKVEPEKLVL